MSVSVVVGGQYGSEGKGKVALYFANKLKAVAAVKVGGTNSGHTVYDEDGNKHVFRVLPTACLTRDVVCVIGPGACFQPELLFKEYKEVELEEGRLLIHPNAGIITHDMELEEEWSHMMTDIGSTTSGTGAATIHRYARDGKFVRACEIPELDKFLADTTTIMNEWLFSGENIIVEGGQGFGLSPYYTPQYPYATSRDTTATAFVAEAGLSVVDVENVIQVLRSYEIRVGGASGPMKHETTWEQVTQDAHSDEPISEWTSVTGRLRRVGYFDYGLVARAVAVNKPNITVMNFMDYIGEEDWVPADMLGPNRKAFLKEVEDRTKCDIKYVGLSCDDVRDVTYTDPIYEGSGVL